MFRWTTLGLTLISSVALASPPAANAPSVSLQDTNPRSATHGLDVSARDFRGQFGLWYFRDAECKSCTEELAVVRKLWQEMMDDGLNANMLTVVSGQGAGAVDAPRAQSTTWLIDQEKKARAAWGVEAGDLLVVSPEGEVRARISLGSADISDSTFADALEYQVEAAAFGEVSTTMVTSR